MKITFGAGPNTENYTIDFLSNPDIYLPQTVSDIKTSTINNRQVLTRKWNDEDDYVILLSTIDKNTLISLSLNYAKSDVKNAELIFNQIFSTFRFLE